MSSLYTEAKGRDWMALVEGACMEQGAACCMMSTVFCQRGVHEGAAAAWGREGMQHLPVPCACSCPGHCKQMSWHSVMGLPALTSHLRVLGLVAARTKGALQALVWLLLGTGAWQVGWRTLEILGSIVAKAALIPVGAATIQEVVADLVGFGLSTLLHICCFIRALLRCLPGGQARYRTVKVAAAYGL